MSPWAEALKERYFGDEEHPFRLFERRVSALLRPEHVLLDAGCGRTAPVLQKFRGRARELIGIDPVGFSASIEGVRLIQGDMANTTLPDCSGDIIMARSVMEHIAKPEETYAEMFRVLRPGGHFVFLTGNMWDYAAVIAKIVPNRFHPWIVARTEGRKEEDVFPVEYRTNTRAAVRRLARRAGFEIAHFEYLGQHPSYFMFNGPLFLLGTAYEKLISRFEPLHFLRGWIYADLRRAG
jgi:SAM-dependent methyltransferase